MDGADFGRMQPAPLMTVREVARQLHVSDRTVWSITVPRGTLPAVRIGRSVRYCPHAVQDWMQMQMSGVNAKLLSA